MRFPFEADSSELQDNLDSFVGAIFSCLESEFLVMPKGEGFVEYSVFEQGYEALKHETQGFSNLAVEPITKIAFEQPISLIVLRAMLGFTPPEWAYVTTHESGVEVTQGFARSLDRRIRMSPLSQIKPDGLTATRIKALVKIACRLLNQGVPEVEPTKIHRLDKADTKEGAASIRTFAGIGAPYAMLLYERFLGRPFAGHRDSVSELVGDSLELAIENILTSAGISYRKTKRAEKIIGFDQAPDFIIPDEFNPQIIIEAKITEDDGTARDKVTRVQHLGALSLAGRPADEPKYQVIACIAGRGFGVRREDMKKLLLATRGKVFTLQNLDRLVECTGLRGFVTTPGSTKKGEG